MGFIESSNTLRFSSNKLLIDLCGQLDINLSKIESWAGVQIVRRGNALSIYGTKEDCDITRKLISDLYSDLERGETLDERELDVYFQQIEEVFWFFVHKSRIPLGDKLNLFEELTLKNAPSCKAKVKILI